MTSIKIGQTSPLGSAQRRNTISHKVPTKLPQRGNYVGVVGTSWELVATESPRLDAQHDDQKNNDHHDVPPRTVENDPDAPGLIQRPKIPGKLVKWHGGSGYKKERHATPKEIRRRGDTR